MDYSQKTNVNMQFKYTHAPVDVIIPFYKQYQLVGECIRNLISKTLGQAYSITLVDDCSPNKEFIDDLEKKKLKNVPLQFIRLDKHSGFGAALQAGYLKTHNPWICFLHADCFIMHSDWLLHMLTTMQNLKSQKVKLISAKVDDGGTGSFDPAVIGNIDPVDDKIVEEPLPLICTLVHRDLFKHIGGFVKNYPYFGYEDEELFWRMKLYDFKQAVCGKAFVHHEGGATAKELLKKIKIKKIVDSNQQKFVSEIRELKKVLR